MHNLLYYMKFGRVSAISYSNYSLLCILLLDAFCSIIWNFVEYKLLFPVESGQVESTETPEKSETNIKPN